jgi:hypothetical protein
MQPLHWLCRLPFGGARPIFAANELRHTPKHITDNERSSCFWNSYRPLPGRRFGRI